MVYPRNAQSVARIRLADLKNATDAFHVAKFVKQEWVWMKALMEAITRPFKISELAFWPKCSEKWLIFKDLFVLLGSQGYIEREKQSDLPCTGLQLPELG